MKPSPYQDPAVAALFGRVAVPAQFAQPARDLAEMIAIPAGGIVLDVGTGTGAFARPAAEAAGPSGLVVGLDPSLAMLRTADSRGPHRVIVGRAPGLPFADATFHAIGASFVVHHCRSYAAALADMNRVCRAEGRIGITEWGQTPNLPGRLWKELVASYVDVGRLEAAFRDLVPWEEWFSLPRNVERALANAGFTAVAVTTREYVVVITPADYVAMKESGVEGTLIRQMLEEAGWTDLRRKARELFQQRFKDSVTFVRDVHFGVATKP
jgi:ubiquinone/menaquinone biosynthesis C-methylase UbiE